MGYDVIGLLMNHIYSQHFFSECEDSRIWCLVGIRGLLTLYDFNVYLIQYIDNI